MPDDGLIEMFSGIYQELCTEFLKKSAHALQADPRFENIGRFKLEVTIGVSDFSKELSVFGACTHSHSAEMTLIDGDDV